MATNPFKNYKEGKESPKKERGESKALQRFESKKGMERKHSGPMKKSGRGC